MTKIIFKSNKVAPKPVEFKSLTNGEAFTLYPDNNCALFLKKAPNHNLNVLRVSDGLSFEFSLDRLVHRREVEILVEEL